VPYSSVRKRWQQVVVCLAGPVAGFILCGLVYVSDRLTGWGDPRHGMPVWFLYISLIFVNLVWGLMNLLPVFPLDGGQVSRELCEKARPGRGLQLALKISIGVATAVAIYSLLCALDARGAGFLPPEIPLWARGSFYTAILFGLLAAQSYQILQQVGPGTYYEGPDDRVPWER
jgi:Zn-dependent protease